MNKILIKDAKVVLSDKVLDNTSVLIEDGSIIAIDKKIKEESISCFLSAKGNYLTPGFIDTHIHVDGDCPMEDVIRDHMNHGTTALLATISTDIQDKMGVKISNAINLINKYPDTVLGLHLEGPYLSKEKAGAQKKEGIFPVDLNYLNKLLNMAKHHLKIMTLAPELKGIEDVVRVLKEKDVIVSMGHSNASYEDAQKAFAIGIKHATHLFNQMTLMHHRKPGMVLALLLEDEVYLELICDLIHLDPAVIKLLYKYKNIESLLLISDCVVALSDEEVLEPLLLSDGTLAGSRISLMHAVKNCVQKCGINIIDVVKMASSNPAKLLGLYPKKGVLQIGSDADIVIFNDQFKVQQVFKKGEIKYNVN